MSSFLVIPSALIQVQGLADLDMLEHRLFWRLVGHVGTGVDLPDDADTSQGVTLRFHAADLLEPGEDDYRRLTARLEKLTAVRIGANLDGRDGCGLWRLSMAFLAETEVKDGEVEVFMGPRMFAAIRDREAFTRVKEASLFAMRGSKYSSRLYILIRDKFNLKTPSWEIDINEFRSLMQTKPGSYSTFDNFRRNVIEPAIDELNETSELTVSWEKGRTFKNRVKTLVFTWKVKEPRKVRKAAKELQRHSVAQGKAQEDAEATPLIVLDRAARYLAGADATTRFKWAAMAVQLGAPEIPAMAARENVGKWASWVAREMAAQGVIPRE